MRFVKIAIVLAVAATPGCVITASDGHHEGHDEPRTDQYDADSQPERHHHVETVVWYETSLPDQGYLDNFLPEGALQGQGGEVHLDPGIYHIRGDKIRLRGGNLTIIGSGTGQTIIDGSVDVKGDNYVFADFGITGGLYLRGANCQVHVYVEGFKDVSGPGLNAQYSARPVPRNNPPPANNPPPPPANNPPPPPANKLPDKGYLDQYLPANFTGEVFLEPGFYKLRNDKINFVNGHLALHGAGKENTFIVGDVSIHGDGYVFTGICIKGDLTLRGNNCTGDVVIRGHKDIKGGNNRGW